MSQTVPPANLANVASNPRLLAAAAMANRVLDPFATPPLTPAMAYAASTAYIQGQVVINGGNWYVCNSPGTTAASGSGPVATTGLTITDGNCHWTYYGPAETTTTDADAPTMSISTSQPSYPLTNTWRCYAVSTGAAVVSSAFKFLGGAITGTTSPKGYAYANCFNAAAGAPTTRDWAVEFKTDAPAFVIDFTGAGFTVQIVIDGRRFSPGGITGITTLENFVTLTFPTRKTRRIRVEFNARSGVLQNFVAVTTSANDQVWAPTDDALRMVYIGDSYASGTTYSAVPGGHIPQRLGAKLGIADVWNMSTSGTGYLNPAVTNSYTFGQRVAQGLAANPSLWVFSGSVNDATYSPAAVTAAVTATIQSVRAGGSLAPIVVFGVQSVNMTGVAATEAAVAAGVAAANDPRTFFVPFNGASPLPWISGSWNNSALSNNANAGQYIVEDNEHPNDLGMAYLASRKADAVWQSVYHALAA
ncbi:MAG: SGNH/GDSL hydrolase family protein [Caulobacteraceae bacterium]|nr:SGNH/GDSL hydrolase family protein [Caulobacteraceae bacterium]